MRQGSLKGSVSKRNGKWRARYWDASGRQRSRTFTMKGHADAWLRDELALVHGGGKLTKDDTTLDTFVETWLGRAALNVRTSTMSSIRANYRNHIAGSLGQVQFRHLTPSVVRKWHDTLRTTPTYGRKGTTRPPLSPATCAKVYKLLQRICSDAVDEDYLATNPCRIKGASAEPDYRISYEEPPTVEEVRQLANAIGDRYRAMVLLAGFGGLRWGEVGAVQRKHVDVKAGTVRIEQTIARGTKGEPTIGPPKTDAGRRTVHLPAEVVAALKLHLAAHTGTGADAYLFLTPDGALLRHNNFNRREWKPAAKAIGKPDARFHDLRHAAATLAALTGAGTKDLMAHMGHKSQVAALRYQHATQHQQAAIAKGLDEMLTPTSADNVVPIRQAQ